MKLVFTVLSFLVFLGVVLGQSGWFFEILDNIFVFLILEFLGFLETCGTNEEFLNPAPSVCQTSCRELGKPCKLRPITAPTGCYCIKGYARDSDWNCIPIADCPPPHIGV